MSQDGGSSKATIKFIRDEPAEEGLISDHLNIAEAIARTVESNPEVKVIGLFGRWGSGKSTVASKALSILTADEPSPFITFTYDAWLHQSDPIRRSFLESLLSALVTATGLQDVAKWRDRIKQLNGQVEDQETTETPTLSVDGRWLTASLVFVPIGAGLLGLDTIKEGLFNAITTSAGVWTLRIGLMLALMPVWTMIGLYLYRRPWKSLRSEGSRTKPFWTVTDENGNATSWLALFSNHPVKQTFTRTVRTGEPTSIEFGRTFQEIMVEVTANNHRLVILIDNLDRVAEKEALQMWATIRSFFLASHETDGIRHEPYHPVVILPIDRHAIEELFSSGDGADEEEANRPSLARGASFIDKTFDVTFEVSEPVSSDWRSFLERQLRYVFGRHYQDGWGFWTRRIFEQSAHGSGPVTPREINKLANRLGALFLQRYDEGIAVEMMAVHIIHRSEIELGLLNFIKRAGERYIRIAPNWDRQLAALHYGVSVEKAAQVLLTEPLRAAITDNQPTEVQQLATIDGFGETFEFVTADLPHGDGENAIEFEIVTNACLALDALKAPAALWVTAAWQNLVNRYFEVGGPFRAQEDLGKRVSILSHAIPAEQADRFVTLVTQQMGALLSVSETPERARAGLIRATVSVIDYAKSNNVDLPLFDLPDEGQPYVKALNNVAYSPALWPQTRTKLDAESIAAAVIELLRAPSEQWNVAGAVFCLVRDKDGAIYGGKQMLGWGDIIEAAGDIIRNPAVHSVSAVPSMTVLARVAAISEDAATALVELVADGTLARRINESVEAERWEEVYMALAIQIWSAKEFGPPDGKTWAELHKAQPKLVQTTFERLRTYFPAKYTEVVWSSYEASSAGRYLSGEMIKLMIVDEGLGRIDVPTILNKLPHYLAPIPTQFKSKFMALLETATTFWPALERLPLGAVFHEAAKLLSKVDAAKATRVRRLATDKIERASKDAWLQAIMGGQGGYAIATSFLPAGTLRLSKTSQLYHALIEAIPNMAAPGHGPIRARWFTLCSLLRGPAVSELYRALATHLIETRTADRLQVLKAGGADFLRKAEFGALADGAVEAVVIPLLQTTAGRDWLKDNHLETKSWIRRAASGAHEHVKQALLKLHSGKNEDRRYAAEILARHWGIKLS